MERVDGHCNVGCQWLITTMKVTRLAGIKLFESEHYMARYKESKKAFTPSN